MKSEDYPALFRAADKASNKKQSSYLILIIGEYASLFIAAIFLMPLFEDDPFYVAYTFVFLFSIAFLLTRGLMKPEQDWYRCRALAESIKTLTWRYVMQAQPFSNNVVAAARLEFTKYLRQVLDENRMAAEKIGNEWSDAQQLTTEMERVRSLGLADRKAIYLSERVQEQRAWYSRKAAANRRSARRWFAFGLIVYLAAIALSLGRIAFRQWQNWPIEALIVLASSIIGWMQTKKFNELGAAYTVAAHEIGLIVPRLEDVANEAQLSDCVNEAELAFSREHTMWIARRSS